MFIKTNNPEQEVIRKAGLPPPGGFKSVGFTRWGPNAIHSAIWSEDKKALHYQNFKTQEKITFGLEGYTFIESKAKPKTEYKNVADHFHLLDKADNSHPYLVNKAVKIPPDLDLRLLDNKLICPIYSEANQMISWQEILPEKPKEGSDKKFKTGHSLGKGYHLVIGEEPTNIIMICEGLATALSVWKITNRQTYVSYGFSNLEPVGEIAQRRNPKAQIVICLDKDKKRKAELKLKTSNKFKVLIPDEFGDFNDHQKDILEQNKLLSLQSGLVRRLSKAPVKPITFLDSNKIFLAGKLMTLTGGKGSLKSSGIVSYCVEEGIKIGYYSDNENDDDFLKTILNNSKNGSEIIPLDLSNIPENPKDKKEFLRNLAWEIEAHQIKMIIEDPMYETDLLYKQAGLRSELGWRVKMASYTGAGWLCNRNYNKNEKASALNRMSGFAGWQNIPRRVLGCFIAHPESAIYKQIAEEVGDAEKIKKISLFQPLISNVGGMPEKSIIMVCKLNSVGMTFTTFTTTPRVENPELWGQKTSKAFKEANETREQSILTWLLKEDKKGIKSRDLADKIIKDFKVSWRTAQSDIKALKTKKLISGGGSGPHSKPLIINKKGRESIAEEG